MKKTIGFIGGGNMGQAMIAGLLNSKLVDSKNITVADLDTNKLENISKTFSINTTKDSLSLAKESDILVLSVKPNIYNIVLNQIKDHIKKDQIIISIAAGKSIKDIESIIGDDKKLVRTMPNTPALVGEGMSALCPNKNITDEDLDLSKSIFESFGKAEIMPEYLIDSVIGVSGSSPAYVFMFIEAMADAAVLGGMPRDKAYTFAAQAVLGSAKMVLETGKHPGELKDMVCSPGGTTIEAVATLEKTGFRSSIIESIVTCMQKSKDMTK